MLLGSAAANSFGRQSLGSLEGDADQRWQRNVVRSSPAGEKVLFICLPPPLPPLPAPSRGAEQEGHRSPAGGGRSGSAHLRARKQADAQVLLPLERDPQHLLQRQRGGKIFTCSDPSIKQSVNQTVKGGMVNKRPAAMK